MKFIEGMLEGWSVALRKWGIIVLILIGFLPGALSLYILLRADSSVAKAVDIGPRVTTLTAAYLSTALDVCQSPGVTKAHKVGPERYELKLDTGTVQYTVTWALGDAVAIDASAAGQPDSTRSEGTPNQTLKDCMVDGAVDVGPSR